MGSMMAETETFYANVSLLIQYVAAGIDLPVRPGPHSCWVGACALSCLRKPSCQPVGSLSAVWPSQTEPQPDLMQSGLQHHPEEHDWNDNHQQWLTVNRSVEKLHLLVGNEATCITSLFKSIKLFYKWHIMVKLKYSKYSKMTYADFLKHLFDQRMFGVDF